MAKYKRGQRGYYTSSSGITIEVEIIRQSPVSGALTVNVVERDEDLIIMPDEFKSEDEYGK